MKPSLKTCSSLHPSGVLTVALRLMCFSKCSSWCSIKKDSICLAIKEKSSLAVFATISSFGIGTFDCLISNVVSPCRSIEQTLKLVPPRSTAR